MDAGWLDTIHTHTHIHTYMHTHLHTFIKMGYTYFCFFSKIISAVSDRKSKMVVT